MTSSAMPRYDVVALRREGDRTPRVTLEVAAVAWGTAGRDPARAFVPSTKGATVIVRERLSGQVAVSPRA